MFDTSHIHPMVVHFPIALIMVGFLADVLFLFFRSEKCLSKTGLYLMVLGALAAVVAWSTGQLFTIKPDEGEIVNMFVKHKTCALFTFVIIVIGAAFRVFLVIKKKEDSQLKWIVFGLYLLAFAGVAFTGFIGGTMVYQFMLGI